MARAISAATVAKSDPLGGCFYSAPKGTQLPSESVIETYCSGSGKNDYQALVNGFTQVSDVSDEGLRFAEESDSTDFTNMDGDTVLTVRTSRKETATVKFIDLNADSLKEVYGADNVSALTGGTIKIKHNGAENPERVGMCLIALSDGRRMVRIIPRYKNTERSDETLLTSELLARDITLTTLPNADGDTVIDYVTGESSSSNAEG